MQINLNKTDDTQVLYGCVYRDPYADQGLSATVSEDKDDLKHLIVIVDRYGYPGPYERWLKIKAEELLEYAIKHKLKPLF